MKSIKAAVQSIREWEGCEYYSNIFEKNLSIFEERIREIFSARDKQPYQILVHGDFHHKNMIYRNNGETSHDFVLVNIENFYSTNFFHLFLCLSSARFPSMLLEHTSYRRLSTIMQRLR